MDIVAFCIQEWARAGIGLHFPQQLPVLYDKFRPEALLPNSAVTF